MFQITFDEPLYGILFCIQIGDNDIKIEEGEVDFIRGLKKSNGNCDILIILFT